MKKRDLKADLRLLKNGFYPSGVERAMEAKADFKNQEDYSDMLESERNELYHLARELVEALEKAIEEVNHPICGPGSVVGDLEEVLAKAKEVLGNEDQAK